MAKKNKDTLIKNYQKKTDVELKDIAIELVNQLENVNLSDTDMMKYQEKATILKTVLDQKTVETESVNPRLYPLVTDPYFNSKTFQNRQFNQYQITIDPDKLEEYEKCDFTLTLTQRFLQSFMSPITPYNSVLLFHGTGVGKTCSSLTIVEQFKPILEKNKQKIYVLVKQSIKDSFLRNLFNIDKFKERKQQCLGDTYFKALGTKGIDWLQSGKYEKIEKAVRTLIKKKYKFMGYGEFSNFVKREEEASIKGHKNSENHQNIKNKALMDKFSDAIFIIDEVHNIGSDDIQNDKPSSHYIERVLTHSKNNKLILLSATPMFDSSTEIISILNMLLMNDKRPIIPRDKAIKNDIITDTGIELISKYSKGYVSYLRGEDPFKFPNRLYPNINKDPRLLSGKSIPNRLLNKKEKVTDTIQHFKLLGSEMSDIQAEAYLLKHQQELLVTKKDIIKYGVQDWPFQLSNIVYPNNKSDVTSNRFDDYFDGDENNGFSYKKDILEFLHPDHIQHYSTKINTILNYIENSEGIVYIYTRYLSDGAYPVAIALEHLGYKRYIKGNTSSSFLKTGKKNKTKSASYILLTGNSANDEAIKKCISPDNKNGEKIKIIIGTAASSEGIDFKNIREVHILDPWHNNNRLEQAIGRAIRFCSHMELEREKRNATVYYHVSTLPGKNKDVETSDIYRYRESEKKAIEIGKIERVLKQNSIDCHLNKSGNVYIKSVLNIEVPIITSQKIKTMIQLGDNEYSRICDFQKDCQYDCLPDKDTDSLSNHITIPSSIEIQHSNLTNIVSLLTELYETDIIFDFTDIFNYLEQFIMIDQYYLYLTLEKIINEKIAISKKNIPGYLIYRNLYYIWQPSNYDETLSLKHRNSLLSTTTNISKRNLNKLINPTESKSSTIDISKLVTELDNKIKLANDIADTHLRNTFLLFFLNSLSELELHKLIEHMIVHQKIYLNVINLLADRIIYNDKKKLIDGYIQISEHQLLCIKYNPDKKDSLFTLYTKDYSKKLISTKKKQILPAIKIEDNELYSWSERQYTERDDKGNNLKILNISTGKDKGKKCVYFQTKKEITKLIDDISDSVTKNAIQNSDYFNILEKGSKNDMCVFTAAIFLYNDSRKLDGKRWFYNEIEIFLYNDFSKENKKITGTEGKGKGKSNPSIKQHKKKNKKTKKKSK